MKNLAKVKELRNKNSNQLKENSSFQKESIYKKEFQNKSERRKIRTKLNRFVNNVLGKDRSEKEIETNINEFISFYKEIWSINDFKIDNFTNTKDKDKLKDYSLFLDIIKAYLG